MTEQEAAEIVLGFARCSTDGKWCPTAREQEAFEVLDRFVEGRKRTPPTRRVRVPVVFHRKGKKGIAWTAYGVEWSRTVNKKEREAAMEDAIYDASEDYPGDVIGSAWLDVEMEIPKIRIRG